MQGILRRVYRYRFCRTEHPARERTRTFRCVRYVDNDAIAPHTEAWLERRERIGDAETDRILMRSETKLQIYWLAEGSGVRLRHRNAAFVHFLASHPQYPPFHRKRDRPNATYRMRDFQRRERNRTPSKRNAVTYSGFRLF